MFNFYVQICLIFHRFVSMLQKFSENLAGLSKSSDRFLLAGSGGVDSMVLADMLLKINRKFALAHCNFSLRGEESDGDEALVAAFAEKNSIPFFVKKFETEKYARENKIGIQEAARNLRYQWFEILIQSHDYQLIVTAHHLNDSAETLLLNLIKGTGLSGLHGIPPRRGNIIRPLLHFSKEELKSYARKNQIKYREDSSNSSEKYNRNLIRNSVIPTLKKVNPAFEKTMAENINRFTAIEAVFNFFIKKIESEIVDKNGDAGKISIQKLRHLPRPATILFEILKPFGFNFDQSVKIITALDSEPGRIFQAPRCRLLVDREFLFLQPLVEKEKILLNLHENQILPLKNGSVEFSCEILEKRPDEFPGDEKTALLDHSKLTFPLTVENWHPGDKFQPLGMNGRHRKLQDFFSDLKLNRFEKENIAVVKSAGEICWVAGFRISEKFKLRSSTKKIARLKILKSKL